jgi:hypothetical protein
LLVAWGIANSGLKPLAEIGSRLVAHFIGSQFTALLGFGGIEMPALPADVKICPASRAFRPAP